MPAVKQTKENIKHILSSYIPEKALDAIADIIIAHRVSVEITRTRKRVHGTTNVLHYNRIIALRLIMS